MKKYVSLLLVLALAAAMFAGTAGSTVFAETIGMDELAVSQAPPTVAEDPGISAVWGHEYLTAATITGQAASDYYVNDGGRQSVRAMVSFTDDDCRAATYDVLFKEVIEPLGIPYTLALPTGRIGTAGYMTETQLQAMLDAGVTISCHTLEESRMDTYTAEALDEMLTQWEADAAAMGVGEVLAYAYCNGVWSDDAMSTVKNHFRMGFTVDSGINEMPYESYYMKRVGLFSDKSRTLSCTIRDGSYLNANGTLLSSTPGQRVTCQPIPVSEGEEYLLTCSAVWKGACYAIYNSAGRVLDKYNAKDSAKGTLLTDHKVRIPEGAAYMIVSQNLTVYPGNTLTVKQLPEQSTLAAAKAYVDQVAQEGGWLIFMTHAWHSGFDAADLKELVAYIQAAEIPIVDVNEAIRTTGNVIEVGTFRKPLEYAAEPYFVVSAEGRVYTNSLEQPQVPSNYENVKLDLTTGKVINANKRISCSDPGYVVSDYVDVSDCEAVLVTGWAYSSGDGKGYQVYTIKDADQQVLASYTAQNSYADGGDALDHTYIELPEGAATIMVAGNIYQMRPALTKIYDTE